MVNPLKLPVIEDDPAKLLHLALAERRRSGAGERTMRDRRWFSGRGGNTRDTDGQRGRADDLGRTVEPERRDVAPGASRARVETDEKN